jgi:SNF2 family DNA or RNA helicase
LGKTIEALALVNLKARSDFESAKRDADAAVAATPAAEEKPSRKEASPIPVIRDGNGAYISRATLIICPVSLISQWIAELREKSTRPLSILSYHGKRTNDPRQLLDYDIVITAYSILSTESSQIGTRSKTAAIFSPWSYEGPSGLGYGSPLGQVHWRRIFCDEGHNVKNAAAECSQQANKLLARCRYLMSGTPFGTSLMDTRGQTKFLGIVGFTGSFLFTE